MSSASSAQATGSSIGVLSSLSSSSSTFKKESNRGGLPFIKMIREHRTYGFVFETKAEYDVRLVHGTTYNLHWVVLLKMKDSRLPYVTYEITTQTMNDLIQTMRTIQEADIPSINPHGDSGMDTVGVYIGSLESVSHMADETVSNMEHYNLFKSNCQHFSNYLLKKMKLIEVNYPTTMPKFLNSLENNRFDTVPIVLGIPEISGKTRIRFPSLSSPPQMDDLIPINSILKPLAAKWKEIGSNLCFTPLQLDEIKQECYDRPNDCLKELLTRYLESLDPKECRTYTHLACAVEKVDDTGTRHKKIRNYQPKTA